MKHHVLVTARNKLEDREEPLVWSSAAVALLLFGSGLCKGLKTAAPGTKDPGRFDAEDHQKEVFAFFAALIQGFVLVFSIELTSVTNTSGEGIDHHDHPKTPPSREGCQYSATESSALSVGAGSGPAPGSAPADPQAPAGISEGSTKPLLRVHMGFLWENVPHVVCAPVGQQDDASFKNMQEKPYFSPLYIVHRCWEVSKIHFTVISLD